MIVCSIWAGSLNCGSIFPTLFFQIAFLMCGLSKLCCKNTCAWIYIQQYCDLIFNDLSFLACLVFKIHCETRADFGLSCLAGKLKNSTRAQEGGWSQRQISIDSHTLFVVNTPIHCQNGQKSSELCWPAHCAKHSPMYYQVCRIKS